MRLSARIAVFPPLPSSLALATAIVITQISSTASSDQRRQSNPATFFLTRPVPRTNRAGSSPTPSLPIPSPRTLLECAISSSTKPASSVTNRAVRPQLPVHLFADPALRGSIRKLCPFCSRPIQDPAVKCRFCLRWLDPQAEWRALGGQYPSRTASDLAIASFICGLFWMYGLGSCVAVLLGYLALRSIRREPATLEGKGFAIARIALGCASIAAIMVIIAVILFAYKQEQRHPTRPAVRDEVSREATKPRRPGRFNPLQAQARNEKPAALPQLQRVRPS